MNIYNFLWQVEKNPYWFFTILGVTVVAVVVLAVAIVRCERERR